jgi:glycosyltransferase involved in cell wall biosynthesis
LSRPLVELILPTHCRPHSLPYAVEAVRRQTVADFRLHVIGDGAGEATEAVVRAVGDPRVAYHAFPKAPGFGIASRNAVLRTLTAPYVAYATDDDLLFPDHLERGLRALEASGRELVVSRPAHVAYPGEFDAHFFAFAWRRVPFRRTLRRWFSGSTTYVHRRTLFARMGYWDETLSRFIDREFGRRAWRAGLAAYGDDITVLRFYARHWDHRYASLSEPPQKRFLERLGDPAWVAEARAAARRPPGLAVRARQWADLARFAFGSGPRLLRYAAERRRRA